MSLQHVLLSSIPKLTMESRGTYDPLDLTNKMKKNSASANFPIPFRPLPSLGNTNDLLLDKFKAQSLVSYTPVEILFSPLPYYAI